MNYQIPDRVYLPAEVARAMAADAPPDSGDFLYVRANMSSDVKELLQRIDASIRFTVPINQQTKLRRYVNNLLITVRQEERRAAFRDAVLIVDTAPLCHCAGKQYVDPVALVQRLNDAFEAAANEPQANKVDPER